MEQSVRRVQNDMCKTPFRKVHSAIPSAYCSVTYSSSRSAGGSSIVGDDMLMPSALGSPTSADVAMHTGARKKVADDQRRARRFTIKVAAILPLAALGLPRC